MLEATFILTTDPKLCRQKEFVRSLCLFQHGKIKGSTVTNGEWTFGETHPPSLQDVVANVNHRQSSSQWELEVKMMSRPMGIWINRDVITVEPISVYLIETCV